MTATALILNLLLGGLLVAALALGLRLDRRLRALRDSQASFIKAVAELDQAATRTQAGLVQWREAADEARELLHDRIEKAKVQTARLEKVLADVARRPEPEPAAVAAAPSAAPSRVPAAAPRESTLRLDMRDVAPPLPRPPARAQIRPPACADDDLFDAAPLAGALDLQRDLAAALGRRL